MNLPARIVLATGNAGKAREIREILGAEFELVTRREIGLAGADETGDSFLDNALLKARQAAACSGLPAIADDSGLEVDALAGAPGVHSARYAGVVATDRDNVAKLLADLVSVPDGKRQARFRCVAVFVQHADDPAPIVAEGISIAIQSAWLLCRRLIARQDEVTAGRAIAETGEDYAAEWRKRFSDRFRAAAWFAYLAMRPGAVTALLPLLARFPGLLTFGAELSGKTKQLDAAS